METLKGISGGWRSPVDAMAGHQVLWRRTYGGRLSATTVNPQLTKLALAHYAATARIGED